MHRLEIGGKGNLDTWFGLHKFQGQLEPHSHYRGISWSQKYVYFCSLYVLFFPTAYNNFLTDIVNTFVTTMKLITKTIEKPCS